MSNNNIVEIIDIQKEIKPEKNNKEYAEALAILFPTEQDAKNINYEADKVIRKAGKKGKKLEKQCEFASLFGTKFLYYCIVQPFTEEK